MTVHDRASVVQCSTIVVASKAKNTKTLTGSASVSQSTRETPDSQISINTSVYDGFNRCDPNSDVSTPGFYCSRRSGVESAGARMGAGGSHGPPGTPGSMDCGSLVPAAVQNHPTDRVDRPLDSTYTLGTVMMRDMEGFSQRRDRGSRAATFSQSLHRRSSGRQASLVAEIPSPEAMCHQVTPMKAVMISYGRSSEHA